jgi:iron complex outermembrane receptor protein
LLNADIQYNDAVYNRFVFDTLNNGPSNGTGCPNLRVTAVSYTVNCSGFRPPFAPLWTVAAGAQQTFPLPNGASVVGTARVHFQTQSLTGQEFLAAEIQRSYATADFALTYSAPRDRYFVTGFVNNAFDRTALQYGQPILYSAFSWGVLNPPRTYGVRAGVHF